MRVRLARRGDVVIVQTRRPITLEQAQMIKDHVERVGLEALVFDGDHYDVSRQRWWNKRRRAS